MDGIWFDDGLTELRFKLTDDDHCVVTVANPHPGGGEAAKFRLTRQELNDLGEWIAARGA